MKQARFVLKEETTRVLDVVKGRYGLKNRNDAINKLVMLHYDDYIEPEFDEKELRALRKIADDYDKKKVKRNMTLEDLDKLLGI